MTDQNTRRPRRRFTAVFRAGAVLLATTSQASIAKTSCDLSIGETLLLDWIAAAGAPEEKPTPDARTAFATLRREARRTIRIGTKRPVLSALPVATATDAYARANELVLDTAEKHREWARRSVEAVQEVASEERRSSAAPTDFVKVRTYQEARKYSESVSQGLWKAQRANRAAETALLAAREALQSSLMCHHAKQAPQVKAAYARLVRRDEEARIALVAANRALTASASLEACENLVIVARSEEKKAEVAASRSERALTDARAALIIPQRKLSAAEDEARLRWNLLAEAKTQAEREWRQFVAAREQKNLDQAREQAAPFIRARDKASKVHVADTAAVADAREATRTAIQAREEAAKLVEAQRLANENYAAAKNKREEHFNANKRILDEAPKAKGRRKS
jgi:hypothetical protein